MSTQGSESKRLGRAGRHTPVAFALALGTVVSILAFQLSRQWEVERLDSEFKKRVDSLLEYMQFEPVEEFAEENMAGLRKIVRAGIIAGEVSPNDFSDLAVSQTTRSSEWLKVEVEWIPRVLDWERADYERRLSDEVDQTFEITELDAQDERVRAGDRFEYFPVERVETNEPRETRRGLDLGADPIALAALHRARDTGQPSILSHIIAVDDTHTRMEFANVQPFYGSIARPRSIAERRANLKGFIAIVTRSEPITAQQFPRPAGGVSLYMVAERNPLLAKFSEGEPEHDLEPSPWGEEIETASEFPSQSASFDVAGRHWNYIGIPRAEFVRAQRGAWPWYLLCGGLLATIILCAYLERSLGHANRIEQLVEARTRELDARTEELVRANTELEREIAERQRAEAESVRLAAFPNENPNPVLESDAMGNVLYLNRAATALLEELGLNHVEEFLPANHRSLIRACRESGADVGKIESGVGDRVFEWNYHWVGPSNTAHLYAGEVTESRKADRDKAKLESQLSHAQKMEAIGTLAGGIAHDFNNLLSGVLGYANMLKLNSHQGEKTYKAADVIEKATKRAAELTGQLLGFARKGKHQNVPVDLHATVKEVITLLRRTINKNISIEQRFGAADSVAVGDPGQMQQIFMNLAINARDAMPDGGTLSFETDPVTVPPEGTPRGPEIAPGSYIQVRVRDTGLGIPDDVQGRVFEPFFTTKEQGKGTGMGLAMVYGIVKNHGGFIWVDSGKNAGTTFEVWLPVEIKRAAPVQRVENGVPISGTGRILVVDDEEVVRNMLSDMLAILGYQVTVAEDGEEAVEYYKEHANEIDLAVIDMVMPKMGGADCFRAMKSINPEVRAILSTGYGRDGAAQEILDQGMMGFAPKPYCMRDISKIVANALEPAEAGR